jgi:5S rRNA maturation endonuclease (ribonuclease M5)
LFVLHTGLRGLILVEGEINALSLKEAFPETNVTIASPGSCTNFMNYIQQYLQYTNIVCIIDYDIPGVVHGDQLRRELRKHKKHVELIPMVGRDINDVLVQEGVDGVKAWAKSQGLEL